MEQRISRCHRQGQQSDVLVINLLCKDNFSDVRIIELINKRVSQFDGIFGMSDDILGNFDASLEKVLNTMRHKDDIQKAFEQNLAEHEKENKAIVANAENTLFRSFTKDIADKVSIIPQYIADKIKIINDDLWALATWYFTDYNRHHETPVYEIDELNRSITAVTDNEPPDLFYYFNGRQNRRYKSLRRYHMGGDIQRHDGNITLTSVFGRNLLDQICCETAGSIIVDANIEPCTIALYGLTVVPKKSWAFIQSIGTMCL